MHVRHPLWLRRVSGPSAEAFAVLFALDSFARALLVSVIPLQAYALVGDAGAVSLLFLTANGMGLAAGISLPLILRRAPRRWVFTAGGAMLAGASVLMATGTLPGQLGGMMARVFGVVVMMNCLSLYIMDNVPRHEFTRSEPMRIVYSALSWIAGPAVGVYLNQRLGLWAPFGLSMVFAITAVGFFWYLRLTEKPGFTKPRAARPPNPFGHVARFFAQPRLALAWTLAAARSSWWAMFFIYVPIYAVESGLGEMAGGLLVSAATGFMAAVPFLARYVRKLGIRRMLVVGFSIGGAATFAAAPAASLPFVAAGFLIVAGFGMAFMDAIGNTTFMLAVHPHERAEMTAVFSTYRDAAELGPPAVFSVLLKIFELPVVFAVSGATMMVMAVLSRRMHPRMGIERARPAAA